MKRIIATIGLLCVGLSGAGHETNAQVTINIFNLNDVLRAKPIDETRFTVQYQTTSMPDTLQPDKKEEETLMLKVGDKCSVYYSYAKFLTDSVLEADKAAGAHKKSSMNTCNDIPPRPMHRSTRIIRRERPRPWMPWPPVAFAARKRRSARNGPYCPIR
mgnify:CR=1 FL=1